VGRRLRLIVRGPVGMDDYKTVREVLDKLTKGMKDVVLVSDSQIDREYSFSPSSFPLAERWLVDKWKREGAPRRRFHKIVREHVPFTGDKQWKEGVKVRRRTMVTQADLLVAFVEPGTDDFETEEMVRLAKVFDVPVERVLI
jgi:hypothetical protein